MSCRFVPVRDSLIYPELLVLNVVSLSNVAKSYGKHLAVADLSLSVPAASLYGFIGPNGSGKTTTIRMIMRIIHPDRGEIEVLGNRSAAAANDDVGYLPEERGLYKKFSVRRMLTYYATLKGMTRRDASDAITHWLDRFELTHWTSKKVETLSKGMTQKVQFIASIIARPKLLILDEPFSGLDPVNTEAIRETILELQNQGTTIIFSTHDMSVAEKMCDFIFMIYKGEKVLDGTLDEVQARYGQDTIKLRWDGSTEDLKATAGINRVINMGAYQELQYSGDPQVLLQSLVARESVQHFEISHPSLHDIFIRIAGPKLNADDRAPQAADIATATGVAS